MERELLPSVCASHAYMESSFAFHVRLLLATALRTCSGLSVPRRALRESELNRPSQLRCRTKGRHEAQDRPSIRLLSSSQHSLDSLSTVLASVLCAVEDAWKVRPSRGAAILVPAKRCATHGLFRQLIKATKASSFPALLKLFPFCGQRRQSYRVGAQAANERVWL